jgi:hypothetical protein
VHVHAVIFVHSMKVLKGTDGGAWDNGHSVHIRSIWVWNCMQSCCLCCNAIELCANFSCLEMILIVFVISMQTIDDSKSHLHSSELVFLSMQTQTWM